MLMTDRKLNLVIVDDSPNILRLVTTSLQVHLGDELDITALAYPHDALAFLESHGCDILLADVEMPGINGFEFVARAKADPTIADIPVIMVTSLSSAMDRRRGADVGVSAYVVKGEFDQKHFVQTVAHLMGVAHA